MGGGGSCGAGFTVSAGRPTSLANSRTRAYILLCFQ